MDRRRPAIGMTARTGDGRGDARHLKVHLRNRKGRTAASKRWLSRQLNDPYVTRARREGLRSRAAFKLAEIDDNSICSSQALSWSISAPPLAAGARLPRSVPARPVAVPGMDRDPSG